MNLMPWKEYFDNENYLCPKEKEGEKKINLDTYLVKFHRNSNWVNLW